MPKVKTGELTGVSIDWAVAIAEGERVFRPRVARPVSWHPSNPGAEEQWIVRCQVPNVGWFADGHYNPHENWSQAGPIIEREFIRVDPVWRTVCPGNYAHGVERWDATHPRNLGGLIRYHGSGATPLIAAMRCYVASKLGEEVEIPKELYHA